MSINLASILSNIVPAITGTSPANANEAKKKDGDEGTTKTGKSKDPKKQVVKQDPAEEDAVLNSRLNKALRGNQAAPQQPAVMPPPQGAFAVPGQGASSGGSSSGKGSGTSSSDAKKNNTSSSSGNSNVGSSGNSGVSSSQSFTNAGASLDPQTNKAASTLDEAINQAGDKPLLVKFGASWCVPCKQFDAQHEIQSGGQPTNIPGATLHDKGNHAILKVDVDQNLNLAEQIGVDTSGIPAFGYLYRKEDGSLGVAKSLDIAKQQHTKEAAVIKPEEPTEPVAKPKPESKEPIEHPASKGPDRQDDSDDEESPFHELQL